MWRVAVVPVLVLLGLAACRDSFVSPARPDLYKHPLDFAMDGGGFASTDGAQPPPDLSGTAPEEDLSATPHDLAHNEDLAKGEPKD